MTQVALSGVNKSFGKTAVIREVDLEIDPVSYTHLTLPTKA